ncbi:hypothetical protein [Sinorhizobium sp. FG01]|uniref:hypothetical protein n=1 Tax=Sinorhizobium sp. FG01 TaxID=1538168 RepID=UPI001FE20228|nr:hypothetical protein [Sinorhizobium sp. FG01]
MRVDRMDGDPERLGQHQGLPTCAAACVDDEAEMAFRQAMQGPQRVGVAAGPELCHPAEKEFKRIESSHASPRAMFDHHGFSR